MEPVEVPIEDVLDLHTFVPKEIPSLLKEYLNACRKAEIYSVRIIHGKGKGLLRDRVYGLLKRLPIVASFSQAPPRAGGWGATIVELRKKVDFESSAWVHVLDEGARTMGVRLKRSQIAQFAIHAKELVAWNRFANLTAITDPVEIAVKQFLDTLSLLSFLAPRSRLLDIGSGGGFPGIPLKVMRPDLDIMLIDASRKKVSFQKYIIRTLALRNIEARHIRAEELKEELSPRFKRGSRGQQHVSKTSLRDGLKGGGRVGGKDELRPYHVIVSKAVSKLERFLDQGIPLLRRPGIMIAMKGRSVEAELESAGPRVEAEGLAVGVKEYQLPHLEIERHLVIVTNSPDTLVGLPSVPLE